MSIKDAKYKVSIQSSCSVKLNRKYQNLPIGGLFSFENLSRASQSLFVAKAKTLSQYHLFSETWNMLKMQVSSHLIARNYKPINSPAEIRLIFYHPCRYASSRRHKNDLLTREGAQRKHNRPWILSSLSWQLYDFPAQYMCE